MRWLVPSTLLVLLIFSTPYSAFADPTGDTDLPCQGLTCTVVCYCTSLDGGGASTTLPDNCTISPDGAPDGDRIHVDVVIRNILGQPMEGSSVTVTAETVNGAMHVWCPDQSPQVGLSDMSGKADFVFERGSVVPAHPTAWLLLPTVDFRVIAQGPGPGGPVALFGCDPQLVVIGPEVNRANLNLLVDSVDFTDFGDMFNPGTHLTDDLRGDLDHDRGLGGDVVDGVDFTIYASHHGRGCGD